MRITVVHQYFLGRDEPGISRFNEMARIWSAAGHRVTVIAGSINHHTGEIPRQLRRKLLAREYDGAVEVWRCYVPAAYRRGYLGRRLGYVIFAFTASLAAIRSQRADVVIATSPPLVVVLPGWLKARLSGRHTPWIFEIRDLWTESAITTGVVRPNSLQARLFYALEAWACRTASLVNVLTPGFRDDMVARHLVDPARVTLIPNGGDVTKFRPGPRENAVRRAYGWGDRVVFLYAGAHGRANALRQILGAAEILRERTDIVFALVGDGPERDDIELEARRRGLANVQVIGPQPKALMPDYITAADVGVAVLQRTNTFKTVYPNKIFDYMACGRPVLLGIDGVARALVCDEAQAGIFSEPENPNDLARAAMRLADDPDARTEMGRRGREWVEANASRESLADRYLGILQDLANSGRARNKTTARHAGEA